MDSRASICWRAAATTADFRPAAAVGIVIPSGRPPLKARPWLAKDRCWQALVDALRDLERKETALLLAAALSSYGGADAFGRRRGIGRTRFAPSWRWPPGAGRGAIGRSGVAARDTGELGVPGAGGLVAAR